MKRRIISILIVLTLVLTMLPAGAIIAFADEPVLKIIESEACPYFVSINADSYDFSDATISVTGLNDVSSSTIGARLWKGYTTDTSYNGSFIINGFVDEAAIQQVTERQDYENYYCVSGSVSLSDIQLNAGDELLLEIYIKGTDSDTRKSDVLAQLAQYGSNVYLSFPQVDDYYEPADKWGMYKVHTKKSPEGYTRYITSAVMGGSGNLGITNALYEESLGCNLDSNGKTFYFPVSEKATTHKFTFTSATVSKFSDLGISGEGFSLSGLSDTAEYNDGVYTLSGLITVPASGGTFSFTSGNDVLISYKADRGFMVFDNTEQPCFFKVDSEYISNADGSLTLHVSGANLDTFNNATDLQRFVLQYTKGDFNDEGEYVNYTYDLYTGKSLSKTADYEYDFVMEPNKDITDDLTFGYNHGGGYDIDKGNKPDNISAYVFMMFKKADSEGYDTLWTIGYSSYDFSQNTFDWDNYVMKTSVSLSVPWNNKSVTVAQEVTTTTGSADIAITNNGYSQMRYKVDDGEFGNWATIGEKLTVETPKIRTYAITFEFKDDNANTVTRTTTVTRQGTDALGAPVLLKITDKSTGKIIPLIGDVFRLMSDKSYELYADLEELEDDAKSTVSIAVTENDNQIGTLKWNVSDKCYKGTISADGLGDNATLTLKASQAGSGEETISVSVTHVPQIYYGNSPMVESEYSDGSYHVMPGADINCYFVGDGGDGIKGYAQLVYKAGGSVIEADAVQMTANNGTYQGTIKVPDKTVKATELVEVRYYLESGTVTGNVLTNNMGSYKVYSVIDFEGFTAASGKGDYSGVSIEITRTLGSETERYHGYGFVDDNGRLSLIGIDLSDGATYRCIVSGTSGEIANVPITAGNDIYTPANLNLPEIYTLTMTYDDSVSSLGTYVVSPRFIPDGSDLEIGPVKENDGYKFKQLPAGTTGKIKAYVYNDNVKNIVVKDGSDPLADGAVMISADTNIKLFAESYSQGEQITATVYKPKTASSDRPIEYMTVTLRQAFTTVKGANGILNSKTVNRSGWTSTEASGNGIAGRFTITRPIGGEDATLTLSGQGYKPKEILAKTDGKLYELGLDANGNRTETPITDNKIYMEYRDELVVKPRLFVRPWNDDTYDVSRFVEINNGELNVKYLTKGNAASGSNTDTLWFTAESTGDGNQLLFINEQYKQNWSSRHLQKNDTIGVVYDEFDTDSDLVLYDPQNGAYTNGVLNSRLSTEIKAYAIRKSQIRANICPTYESADLTGTLLIYRNWNSYDPTLVGQATGRGELVVGGLPEIDGASDIKYTAVALKYNTKYAPQITTMIESGALPDAYFSGTAEAQAMIATKAIGTLKLGHSMVISGMSPAAAGPALLGDYLVQYSANQTRADGTVEVSAWVSSTVANPRPITGVTVYRTNSAAGEDVVINGNVVPTTDVSGNFYWDSGIQTIEESINRYSSTWNKVSDNVTYLNIRFTVKPNENREVAGGLIRFHYAAGGEYGGDGGKTEMKFTVKTSQFGLSAQQRQMVSSEFGADGRPTVDTINNWTIPVTITASQQEPANGKNPQFITIYDNGTEAGTYELSGLTTTVDLKLSDPGVYGMHELYATRADVRSAEAADLKTDKISVTIADPDKEINANHIIWFHDNDHGKQQWNYRSLSDLGSKTIRYWPSHNSAFAFVIANATGDRLENVRLVTSYKTNKEYASYAAREITRDQFMSLWNRKDNTPAATLLPTSVNGKDITYSYWIVDAASINGRSASYDIGDFNVVTHGFPIGSYFSGFSVKYEYKGPGANLTLASLMPKKADTWKNMSDKAFETMLGIVDYSENSLNLNSLKAYYDTNEPDNTVPAFGTTTSALETIEAIKNGADGTAFNNELNEFLLSEVDDMPEALRNSIYAKQSGTDADAVKVDTSASVRDSVEVGPGEEVLDAYSVTIKGDGTTLGDTKVTRSISSVNIISENYGENKGGGNWLNSSDQTKSSYVAPDSEEAVRWLMNYERDKKYNGTDAERRKYENVAWTHYLTEQGEVFERSEVIYEKDGAGNIKATSRVRTYLPDAAIIKLVGENNANSIASGSAIASVPRSSGSIAEDGVYGSLKSLRTVSSPKLLGLKGKSFTEDETIKKGMTAMETVGEVNTYLGMEEELRHSYNTAQYVKTGYVSEELAGKLADRSRIVGNKAGTALNVVNVAVTAYNISKGPQGGDEDYLYNLLNHIDVNKLADDSIRQDILDYADKKGDLYLAESMVGSINAGTSFVPNKAVQGLTLVSTAYASYKGKTAHEDLDDIYDQLVVRLTNELSVQKVRQAREDQANVQAVTNALRERLITEGYEGYRLDEEMSKFNIVRAASGEFGYVPIEGWRQGDWPEGYCPEQPDPDKFDVDWGPSFGGKVPTEEDLKAFYGTDDFTNELQLVEILAEKVEAKADGSKSLEEMINKVENDLKTDPSHAIDIDYSSTFELEDEAAAFKLYIDPAGYVFEAVEEDRIGGVTATIYQGNGDTVAATTAYHAWTDTNEDADARQANPATTAAISLDDPDAGGRYGWMTPAGAWKVGFHDNAGRYLDAETRAMDVPPEHTAVNIGLLATAAPAVSAQTKKTGSGAPYYSDDAKLAAYSDRMIIVFDKWMQLESIVDISGVGINSSDEDFDAMLSTVTVTDANGNVISGKISFPDRTKNTGYKASVTRNTYDESGNVTGTQVIPNDYQNDLIGSDFFVKTVVFTPDTDFTANAEYTLAVNKTSRSYAGVAMTADFSATVAASEYNAPAEFTVTFIYFNGTANSIKQTNFDGTVDLPSPTRTDYDFDGWFTEQSGGTKVDTDTIFTEDTVLYAQWTKKKSDGGSDTGGNGGSGGGSGSDQAASPVLQSGTVIEAKSGETTNVETEKGTAMTVNVPAGSGATLSISAPGTSASTVVYIVNDDGIKTLVNDAAFDKDGNIIVRLDESATIVVEDNVQTFTDVSADRWSKEAIDFVASRGLFRGNGDGTMNPSGTMSRAMVAQVLYNLDRDSTSGIPANYSDADQLLWFSDAVGWASSVGLMNGQPDGRFHGNDPVTKEQIVTVLYRYAQRKGMDVSASVPLDFPDSDQIDPYAKEAMQWAVAVGLIKGDNGYMHAFYGTTREQMATLIMRFVNMMNGAQ